MLYLLFAHTQIFLLLSLKKDTCLSWQRQGLWSDQEREKWVVGVQVLRLATRMPGEPAWRELTAAGDPLQLRVTRSLDATTSELTLQFQACNRLTVEIKNAGIK